MQGIEDQIFALIRSYVPGNRLRAAADHHLMDIALDQHLQVAVGDRHRVIVASITHQGERAHPSRTFVTGIVG